MATHPAWGEQGMAGVSLVADPVLLGRAFHWDLDRGRMLGWILALVGDGLGRMEPSCPTASPVQAPGRLQPPGLYQGTWGHPCPQGHPVLVQAGRGDPQPPTVSLCCSSWP